MNDEQIEEKVMALFGDGEEEVETTETTEETVAPPVDLYQQGASQRREKLTSKGRGASPRLALSLEQILAGPLPIGYKQAKHQSEQMEKQGDVRRSQLVKQQYMQEYYMPAVDALVRLSSPEQMLASEQVLKELDKFVLIPGSRGTGYTRAFVLSMYEEGVQPAQSDHEVELAVNKVKQYCYDGLIRQAVGLADRTLSSIERGENYAIPEDFELLEQVSIRGLPL